MQLGLRSLDRPHVCEVIGRVAPATVVAELSVMHIISPVTVTAAVAELLLHRERPPVAVFAGHHRMCAIEHKVSLQVVIELPLQPVDRVVAAGAARIKATVMTVVFQMTVDASRRRVVEDLGLMTGVTLGIRM